MDFAQDLQPLPDATNPGPLTYIEAMDWLCHLALRSLPVHKRSVQQLLYTLDCIDALDMSPSVSGRYPITPPCIQELQQTLAFQLHKSFVISTLCRLLVSNSGSRQLSDENRSKTLEQFQIALRDSAQAYIRLRSITEHARRSWAFIHNGLTSVLLLSLMEETRYLPETRKLQNEMIASLSDGDNREDSFGHHGGPSHISESLKKVVKAIRTLQSLTKADIDSECNNPGPGENHQASSSPTVHAGVDGHVSKQVSTTREENRYFSISLSM